MTRTAETLHPERAALVVVDLQEKLLPAIDGHDRVLKQARMLLRLARVLHLPVLLTTQYAKGLGPTVPDVLAETPDVIPIDKTAFGCFGSAAFGARVKSLERRSQLLVAGIETHICVMQTVLGAVERGLVVHVASDATGARTEANHRIGLARMERAGAVLSSTEMAIYELLARSDTPAFKAMLPYLKNG
jgi:nicotinamidase-related amidase